MTELRPYPVYRDSGVEWLGEVPEHWEVRRLGPIGRFFKGNGGTKADETEAGVPCVRYGDLYTRQRFFIVKSKACVAHHRAGQYTPIRYGDVLFAGSGETLEEIGRSAVNLIKGSAVCGGDVIVFRPSIDLDAKFIGWSTDCKQAASRKARMGRGITVMHIYSSDLKYLATPLPPLPEQSAIARFLDDADRRIQRYIRAKKRLVDLLEEQKQAIIHQAVTGQIDVRTGRPYTAYKDSGVEWLGEVPEHWEVCPLRRCVTICGGMTPSMDNRRFWSGEIPWVTPKDMKKDAIDNSRLKVTETALKYTSLKEVDPGAVLIVVRGMILARTVPVAWTTVPVTINQDMKALTPCPRVNAEFLGNQLGAAQQALLSGVDVAGHGTRRLPTQHWRALPVAIPPQDEQQHIVDAVRDANRIATKATGGTQVLIECAKEYRTRLIADVVTGKLDVRAAAGNLPEADPITDGNRVDTIQTASHPHAIERDMA